MEWLYDNRIASFDGIVTEIAPSSLADAGFHYENGLYKCHCCGLTTKGWEVYEDPLFVHAQYAPACSYIRAKLGDEYIYQVYVEGKR